MNEPKKKRTRLRKAVVVMAVILALLLALLGFVYWYYLGGLKRDTSLDHKSDQDLGIRISGSEIARSTHQQPVREPTYPTDDLPVLHDDSLPEEAKRVLNIGGQGISGYLKEGYEQIQTIVLYGTNEQLSDTIMLAVLDPVHYKIKLISIARDTRVFYPTYGVYAKLNHAYAWGGPELAISTLNYNLYFNIKQYMAVSIENLPQIIDMVGGVNVNLTAAESTQLWRFGTVPGWNLLNGEAAVVYSRIRSIDSDIQRTGRQRVVLRALMDRFREMPKTELPELVRKGLQVCSTNLSQIDLLQMAGTVLTNDWTIEEYFFPSEDCNWWGGIIDEYWYFVYNLEYASDRIYSIVYEDLYISEYDGEAKP